MKNFVKMFILSFTLTLLFAVHAFGAYGDTILWQGSLPSGGALPVEAAEDSVEHSAIACIVHAAKSWNIDAQYYQIEELYFDKTNQFRLSPENEETIMTVMAFLLDISGAPVVSVIELNDEDSAFLNTPYLTETNIDTVKEIVYTDEGWVNIICSNRRATKIMNPGTGEYSLVDNKELLENILRNGSQVITLMKKSEDYFDIYDETDIVIDNEILDFKDLPVNLNNFYFVPLRPLAAVYSAELSWIEGEYPTIHIIKNSTDVFITIGSSTCTVNGEELPLPAPAFISENGNAMVPLRTVSEIFGINVKWINESKTIILE